jgi:DNA-binding IclR family transcriptional regulator
MANLQVLENFDVRIVAEVRSVRYERLVDREGERWAGHRTVAGIVLLSQLVEPERRRYLTTLASTESPQASAELAEVLSVVRADRVYSNDTFDPLLAAIACPIVTPDEACHGALSIVGVRAEMADPDLRDRSVDLLRTACSALAAAIAEPGTSVADLLS